MRTEVPDDPIIRHLELYGVPPWYKEPPIPKCPICGQEAETYYVYKDDNEIAGCDKCIKTQDAVEYTEQQEGNE